MRSSKTAIQLVLPALILLLVSVALGQTANAPDQSQDTNDTTRTRTVADREQFIIEDIVTKSDGNVLTLRGLDQKETAVFIPETDINLVRKVLFRRDKTTGPTQILNRRTEIKFLINRGIASQTSSEQTSSAQLSRQP